MRKTILILTAFASIMQASMLFNCAGVSDVTQLNPASGNSCQVAGSQFIFSNFTVGSSAGFTSATVGIAADAVTRYEANETYLHFQFGGIQGPGSPAFGDIILNYLVTGPITGIDLSIQASPLVPFSNITVTEVACSVAFVNAACPGVTLANLMAISFGNAVNVSQSFAQVGAVWIRKDIQFNGATSSELVNSHASTVPEPWSVGLVGLGLLGIWVARRGI